MIYLPALWFLSLDARSLQFAQQIVAGIAMLPQFLNKWILDELLERLGMVFLRQQVRKDCFEQGKIKATQQAAILRQFAERGGQTLVEPFLQKRHRRLFIKLFAQLWEVGGSQWRLCLLPDHPDDLDAESMTMREVVDALAQIRVAHS